MAHLRARKDRSVREHAQGQGARNLPQPPALRRAADPAGGRHAVRDQPRAGAANRGAAQKAAEAIPEVTGFRYRAGRAVSARVSPDTPLLRRDADAIISREGEEARGTGGQALCESERAPWWWWATKSCRERPRTPMRTMPLASCAPLASPCNASR